MDPAIDERKATGNTCGGQAQHHQQAYRYQQQSNTSHGNPYRDVFHGNHSNPTIGRGDEDYFNGLYPAGTSKSDAGIEETSILLISE